MERGLITGDHDHERAGRLPPAKRQEGPGHGGRHDERRERCPRQRDVAPPGRCQRGVGDLGLDRALGEQPNRSAPLDGTWIEEQQDDLAVDEALETVALSLVDRRPHVGEGERGQERGERHQRTAVAIDRYRVERGFARCGHERQAPRRHRTVDDTGSHRNSAHDAIGVWRRQRVPDRPRVLGEGGHRLARHDGEDDVAGQRGGLTQERVAGRAASSRRARQTERDVDSDRGGARARQRGDDAGQHGPVPRVGAEAGVARSITRDEHERGADSRNLTRANRPFERRDRRSSHNESTDRSHGCDEPDHARRDEARDHDPPSGSAGVGPRRPRSRDSPGSAHRGREAGLRRPARTASPAGAEPARRAPRPRG